MLWLISFEWAYSRCEEGEPRITKWKNYCPQWDSNPTPSAYEANALTIALLDLISIEHLKLDCVLPEFAI